MAANEISKVLRKHDDLLKKYNVKAVFLFGSCLRSEEKENSDIDFIIDFKEPVSILEHVKLKNELEIIFGRQVDIVTRKALKPAIRENILKEAVAV
ncbi:MAG: nucleotidyltransferase family protein [Elusimicrobia bacterium]|nr:nucleotidyltransferase family protein [Candidatus Liberimonas magnetica]